MNTKSLRVLVLIAALLACVCSCKGEPAAKSEEDIEKLLKNAGFELLAKYGDDTFEPPTETTQRIVYVARCIDNGQTLR